MRVGKKQPRAAYAVLVVLAVIALVMYLCWDLIPNAQRTQAIQEYEDSLAQLGSVTPMGETMVLDSEKKTVIDFEGEPECLFDWSGTVKVKVLSADLYDSRAAAKLVKGFGEGDFDDGKAFLLCKVEVKNVDAHFTKDNGWMLTEIKPKGTFGELTYERCGSRKRIAYSGSTPFACLEPGQVETYVLGWCLYEVPSSWELDFDHEKLTTCTLEVTDHRGVVQ